MKKKSILLIILVFAFNYISSQPDTQWQLFFDGTIARWAYSGGDEFDGSFIDESKWKDSYPWERTNIANGELEYYTEGNNNRTLSYNTDISSGTLKLIAKNQSINARAIPYLDDNYVCSDGGLNLRTFNKTSGMIFSNQKFKYGLYEIRFKTPYGQGFWPAFWLYADNPPDEIDVFEMKGENPNKVRSGNVCDDNGDNIGDASCGGGQWFNTTGNFPDGFNVIRVEWGPDYMVWSLNSIEYYIRFHSYNYPMWIIANLAIASDNGAFSPGPNISTPFPSNFEIDYIRAWTRLDCNESVILSNYSQLPTYPTTITGNQISMDNSNLNSNEYLSLIATNEVQITNQTTLSGTFSAKIVSCPNPRISEDQTQLTNDSTIKVISDYDPETGRLKLNPAKRPVLLTKIYPNPTEGKITIEFDGVIERKIKIELFNSENQLVFLKDNISENKFDIDISKLSKGIYTLKGTFGNSVITDRIVLN